MRIFFSLIICLFLLNSCSQTEIVSSYSRSGYALGTAISVKVFGADEESALLALDKAFFHLHEVEVIASAKLPDSELSFVNQNAAEQTVKVSEELFFLLERGVHYSALTNGAFDITLGSIVELWGIGAKNDGELQRKIPNRTQIKQVLENCGYEYLLLDKKELTVRFLKDGLKIDLGAIAKGYAADEMKRVLLESGITSAILDLGGNIHTIGDNDGKGWLIGITNPLKPGEVCGVVRVFGKTVVTSGNYERYFEHEGVRYHHIFNRKTGFPADNGIISATIITESSMEADALSTALFVSGNLENIQDIDYIIIDKNMNFTYSEGLEFEIFK